MYKIFFEKKNDTYLENYYISTDNKHNIRKKL